MRPPFVVKFEILLGLTKKLCKGIIIKNNERRKLFPLSEHQLCLVHLARNLRSKLSPKQSKQAIMLWKKIKMASDSDEGSAIFDSLIDFINSSKPDYAKFLKQFKNNYINFLKYPYEIRKYIYTTNIVESINSGLERMRYECGGYFASPKMLEINVFIQLINLHDSWLTKPVPILKSRAYEIKQFFELKFGKLDNSFFALHNF